MQVNMKYFRCDKKKYDFNNKKTIEKHTIKKNYNDVQDDISQIRALQ